MTEDTAQIPSNEITDAEAQALARAIVNLFAAWRLSDPEACILLGGLSAEAWNLWKNGNPGSLDPDLRIRMAHLIGIHKGVRQFFKDAARGYNWIKAPNTSFGGGSALDVMLQGKLSDLIFLRSWLEVETNR